MALNVSKVSKEDLEGGFVIVPEGKYIVQAKAAEETVSSNGNDMMYVEFEIIQDEDGDTAYEGLTVKHWFVDKENDKGKNWGMIALKKFAVAAGIDSDSISDTEIIGSMPVEILVEIEEGNTYIDKDGEERQGYDNNKVNPFSFKQGV
jgi:hypothetical protein